MALVPHHPRGSRLMPTARRLAAVAVLVITAALALGLAAATSHAAAALVRSPDIDTVVVVAIAGTGAGACALLEFMACASVLAPVAVRRRLAAVTPAAWRRLAAVAFGTSLSVGVALPAAAGPGWVEASTADEPPPVGWITHEVADTGDSPSAPQREAAPAPTSETHRVRPGQSLWSITSDALGTGDAATIAAAWPALYEANRATVGPDPDVIQPGQELTYPQEWPS